MIRLRRHDDSVFPENRLFRWCTMKNCIGRLATKKASAQKYSNFWCIIDETISATVHESIPLWKRLSGIRERVVHRCDVNVIIIVCNSGWVCASLDLLFLKPREVQNNGNRLVLPATSWKCWALCCMPFTTFHCSIAIVNFEHFSPQIAQKPLVGVSSISMRSFIHARRFCLLFRIYSRGKINWK